MLEQEKLISKNYFFRNWNVILPSEKQALSVGDVLKLGRVRLKIDRIYTRKFVEDCSTGIANDQYTNQIIKTQHYFIQQIKNKNASLSK